MKYIEKGSEPPELTEWKAKANEDWQPTYADLSGKTKKAIKRALIREQGAICCYCERQVVDADSHIEHLRPQSDPTTDPLEFCNMLCSCQSRLRKGEPRHCGNLKGDWFHETLLVSPLDPSCEGRFVYTADGAIYPRVARDRGAAETIKRLGLSIERLNGMRKGVIEPFLEPDLSAEEITRFVAGYLEPAEDGTLAPFPTTIRHLFGEGIVIE